MQGTDCKMYYDADPLEGAPATATWAEITLLRDVSVSDTREKVDATTRASGGRKGYEKGHRDVGFTAELKYDTSDAAFAALRTAYQNGTEIAVAVMDGDITTEGSTGVVGNYWISDFSNPQPLEDLVVVNVEFVPAADAYHTDYTVPAP